MSWWQHFLKGVRDGVDEMVEPILRWRAESPRVRSALTHVAIAVAILVAGILSHQMGAPSEMVAYAAGFGTGGYTFRGVRDLRNAEELDRGKWAGEGADWYYPVFVVTTITLIYFRFFV